MKKKEAKKNIIIINCKIEIKDLVYIIKLIIKGYLLSLSLYCERLPNIYTVA